MLTIKSSANNTPEREYIFEVILGNFLGIDYRIEYQDRVDISIGAFNKDIILPDVLLQYPEKEWLSQKTLPRTPLTNWDLSQTNIADLAINHNIPIIYGRGNTITVNDNNTNIKLPLDIFGSAFFMLTRYEEIVKSDHDIHGRFPAKASLAYQEGFLERPIINEYLEILWWAMKQQWPQLNKKNLYFKTIPTHDIDAPYDLYFRSPLQMIHRLGLDLFKNKNPNQAYTNLANWGKVKKNLAADPYDTFSWIMDQSDQAGTKSAFYFMSGGETKHDKPYPFIKDNAPYQLSHPHVFEIISTIISRGHEVGFHPSYDTAFDHVKWNYELSNLNSVAKNVKISSGRQHFLRFKSPDTWRIWANSPLEYDSTLYYAEHAGFRCGICYDYPVFDLMYKNVLHIKERPLILMECTLIEKKFMGLGLLQKSFDLASRLKNCCKKYNGNFVLLWHNSRLLTNTDKTFYSDLLLY